MCIKKPRLWQVRLGEGEVGCVIVRDGQVLAVGHDEAFWTLHCAACAHWLASGQRCRASFYGAGRDVNHIDFEERYLNTVDWAAFYIRESNTDLGPDRLEAAT